MYDLDDAYYAIVYAERDLTLELEGTNTLKQTAGDSDTICINSGSLTITGDGSLTYSDNGYGIFADKTITINGGSITTNDDGYNGLRSKLGDIIINGGNVTAFADIALRAVSGSVKINGGTVTVTGITRAIDYSISGSFTVAEGLYIQASTTVDGALGEYVAENHSRYKKIVIKPTASTVLKGDVNNDGAINQYDYILVKRHYFGTRYLTDDEMTRADVNSDGAVNQYDYILIKRHYFGTFVIGG